MYYSVGLQVLDIIGMFELSDLLLKIQARVRRGHVREGGSQPRVRRPSFFFFNYIISKL